ncbi:unnamed protein product [Rhizopus stolonifer]
MYKVPSPGEMVEKNDLPTVKYLLYSSDYCKIKQSIELLRKYLVQDNNQNSAKDLLSLDILPRIKELLASNCENVIKFECSWILTNIAAGVGSQTNTIVENGFVDVLLQCVNDKECGLELNYQAAWALANIAGESSKYREELMIKGFCDSLVRILDEIFDEIQDLSLSSRTASGRMFISDRMYDAAVEALMWSLSNMARGGFCTADYWEKYVPMFQVLSKYILLEVPKLEADVCWGISRILYNMHDVDIFYHHTSISDTMCQRLIHILSHGKTDNVVPALRTIINISSGPTQYVSKLLNTPILNSITRLLDSQVPCELRKDSYLVISNLAAGSEETVDFVIKHTVVMQNVISHIRVPGHIYDYCEWVQSQNYSSVDIKAEWKVTKEALWIVFNLATVGNDTSVDCLLKQHPNMPEELARLLKYIDLSSEVCEKILDTMISLIQRTNKWVGDQQGKNPYVRLFLQNQTPVAISTLQDLHYGTRISDLCSKLANLLLLSEENVGYTTAIVDTDNMADAFGLPSLAEIKSKSHKRRVIRGREDGDVRLIENAVNNLTL